MSKNKTPKVSKNPTAGNIRVDHLPSEKQIKQKEQPSEDDTHNPAWQFHRLDKDHELWGWDQLQQTEILDIIEHLANFEGMTWQKIKEQSGGRRHGTNSHSLPFDGFTKNAQKRIKELNLDEFDGLFSLRLSSTIRLYGLRSGRALKLIWYDPYHGNQNGAYPTQR